ncbi:hypothetical protein HUT02_25295, partial [Pseudomonas protegens]|nr:hypothetical protein [Pseudomonas protegens]
MSAHTPFGQPLLTFPDAEKSPLSIRAKALVFVDPRSRQLREELEQLAPQFTETNRPLRSLARWMC